MLVTLKCLLILVSIYPSHSEDYCATSAKESFPCQIDNLTVSRRIATLRDLAWLLTPHSYLITNGNQYTFRSLHESLLRSCATDQDRLSGMKIGAYFDMRNLVIFVEPEWLNNKTETPFQHMICEPKVDRTMWYNIYDTLFKLPIRDFPSVEGVLEQLAKRDRGIIPSIRNFGRFICKSNPICQNKRKKSGKESTLCHGGVDIDPFKEWDLVVTWTDHISGTGHRTGTGFMVQGCLNGHPSWAIFSKVHHQSGNNMKEVQEHLKKGQFTNDTHCWGNYNDWQ